MIAGEYRYGRIWIRSCDAQKAIHNRGSCTPIRWLNDPMAEAVRQVPKIIVLMRLGHRDQYLLSPDASLSAFPRVCQERVFAEERTKLLGTIVATNEARKATQPDPVASRQDNSPAER